MQGDELPGGEKIWIVDDLAETELSIMSEIAVQKSYPIFISVLI
jgi:hypothetical protein